MNFALLILTPVGAAGLAWSLNRLAIGPWRRAAQLHWTERARRLYPVRTAAANNLWLIPACLVLAQQWWLPDATLPWPVTALAAWCGVLLGSYPFDRLLFPWLRWRDWLYLAAANGLLRLGFWVLFVVAVIYMPPHFGWLTWTIAGVMLGFILLLNYGLGLWLARRLRLLQPPPERLQRIMDAVAGRMGIAYRRLWLLRHPTAVAAAWPTTGDLVFSERVLPLLSDDEIAAIGAHELGHLAESRFALLGRLAGSLALLPWLLINPALQRFETAGVAVLALTSLAILVAVARLARRMEVRADRLGRAQQAEGGVYANALERLYEANQLPAVMPGRRKAHPHLYDRLIAAGILPLYPRPKPPHKLTWTGVVLVVAFILLLAGVLGAVRH